MFGHRFYGSAYYGPRYFGEGGTGTPIPDPTPPAPTAAGSPGKRRERYYVEIDGEGFFADDYQEAVSLLERAKDLAQVHAPDVAKRAERRIRRRGRAVDIRLDTPRIATQDDALRELVAQYRDEIREIYLAAAREAELRELLRRKFAEEDEEDAVIAILLH